LKIQDSTGNVLFAEAKEAVSFWQRLKGLMFSHPISPEDALVFYHAPSIHTCFMGFTIDVIFLNTDLRVIRVVHDLKPWRAVTCPKAFGTIEVLGGEASRKKIQTGELLLLKS